MVNHPAPNPVYLGPPSKSSPGSNKPIRRIVIHSTVSPCQPGQARATAAYFRGPTAGGSAHYAVDPDEVVQCGYDSTILWHAPPNTGSIGVEMCEFPETNTRRWRDDNHRKMFDLTVDLVAQLCLAYDVPPYFRDAKALANGKRGVTTHAEVSAAFKQSTHWDPGAWPRRRFMLAVRRRVRQLVKERSTP